MIAIETVPDAFFGRTILPIYLVFKTSHIFSPSFSLQPPPILSSNQTAENIRKKHAQNSIKCYFVNLRFEL